MLPSSRTSSTKHQSARRGTASRAIAFSVSSNSSEPASTAPTSASALERCLSASSSATPDSLAASMGASLGEPFDLVFAQVALEQAPVALLVVEDRDHHVLRHEVEAVGELDDAVVVLDRAGLGLDHALDHVDDVRLVLRRLEVGLLGAEVERAGDDAVELLDPARELLRVAELLLDVGLERLDDLLRPHAVRVDRVGEVAHDGLDLHPVGLLQESDQLLALRGLVVGQDAFGGVAD